MKRFYILPLLLAMLAVAPARAQSLSGPDWKAMADSTLGTAALNGIVAGAAVVVVDRGGTLYSAGYGVSRIESSTPVTDSTLFQVGSIGKVVTAMAVLQQSERGSLELHRDVNGYLTDWKVKSPGNSPLTLHHLLTHSAGLNERALGYARRSAAEVAPLAGHMADSFPAFFAEPGRYISYSNYGFGLAGLLVETVSGRSFTEYVSAEVLVPLGMHQAGYFQGTTAQTATGYRGEGDFSPTPELHRPVIPAGSLVASSADMAKLLQSLLTGGSPVLSAESVAMMLAPQMAMDPTLMGNTYGLEESRWGSIRGFGKGGSVPGFFSYMVVIPEQGLGLFVTVNGSNDDPIDRFVLAAMGAISEEVAADLGPAAVVDLTPFLGEYRNNRYDRTSLEKLLNFEVHEIYEAGDGALRIWHEGQMNLYRPVGDKQFQHESNPHRRLVFELDDDGRPTHAYFNDRMAGGYVPVVWEKTGFWNSNQYINEYFGFTLLVALSYLLLPVGLVVGWALRRRRKDRTKQPWVQAWMHAVGFLTSGLLLIYVVVYFIPLLQSRPELVFGIPENLARWADLIYVVLGGYALLLLLWGISFRRLETGWLRSTYWLVYLVGGALIWEFSLRWNLV